MNKQIDDDKPGHEGSIIKFNFPVSSLTKVILSGAHGFQPEFLMPEVLVSSQFRTGCLSIFSFKEFSGFIVTL